MNKEINYNYKLPPFKWFCLTNFPFIEADFDALTYYELLCKVVQYLNEVIVKTNAIGEQTEELTNAFNTLKEYVDTYFDNLDVQEEINNKLDDMVEQGTLQEIISQYLNSTAIFGFDTVNDMINATNLISGSYAKTMGYYSKNDNGGNTYYISNTSTNDIRTISLGDNLYAIAINNGKEIIANKYGVHADGKSDDTLILQNIIDYCYNNNLDLIINGYCYTTDTIELKGVKIKGVGKIPYITATYVSSQYGNIGFDYLNNKNNGALITLNDFLHDKLKTGSGIISDTANPIVNCDYQYGHINLENITICGWLRNTNQEGLTTSNTTSLTYLWGQHSLNKVNVVNCGSNAIHINSLETTTINDLHCDYNFGNGMLISGINGVDTPFEYVDFNSCSFNGNKENGFYALNSYRKSVKFNNCSAVRIGLYNTLDNMTIPTNTSEIYAGFRIEGKESTGSNTTQILEFDGCYGENTNVLISLPLYQNSFINNKITIKNCSNYPTTNNDNYCLAYLSTYYSDYFNYHDNFFNGTNQLIFGNINHITPLVCDEAFYSLYMNKLGNLSFDSHLNVTDLIYKKYGNMVTIGFTATATAEIASNTNLMSNFPRPIANLRQPIMINGVAYNSSLWINDSFKTPNVIPNNGDVRFFITYPVPITQ